MLREQIEHVLASSAKPLYAHEIIRRQRSLHPFVSGTEIQHELLQMLRDKSVTECRKRYHLSIKSRSQLEEIDSRARPNWEHFRALCRYYVSCLRAGEGANAKCSLTDHGKKFITRPLSGIATPKESSPWSHTFALDAELANLLAAKKHDDEVVLGYPLLLAAQADTEFDETLAVPVFCLKVEVQNVGNKVLLSNNNPFLFLNQSFLEHLRFKRYPDAKVSAFRQATGDTDPSVFPSFGVLANILTSFFADLCDGESINPTLVRCIIPDFVRKKDTIINSAVLMIAQRPRFSLRLINELQQIIEMEDETLSQTALSGLFGDASQVSTERRNPSDAYALTSLDLSYTQHTAVRSILTNKLSCITGPPGSGKSQVAASIATHCLITQRSLLFSSYNHKALDAVCEKTQAPDETHSSFTRRFNTPDKNEALTLTNVIEDLQATPRENYQPEKLVQLKRDLLSLATKTQSILDQAQKTAHVEHEVNRLEKELALVLEYYDESVFRALLRFPARRVLALGKSFLSSSFRSHVTRLINYCFHKRLIKTCLDFCVSGSMNESLPRKLLLHRKELEDLRRCLDLHEDIKALEAQSKDVNVANLSEEFVRFLERQNLLANTVVSHRLREPYPDKHAFSELKSLVREWRRELRTGRVRDIWASRERTLLESLLRHYSCSAVTNLSVGRFFPLLPALFDHVVIDEAAACDFPSAIPLLFRATSAGIVGDPHQLSPIVKLRDELNEKFQAENGLTRPWVRTYDYKSRSLFDVVESSRSADKIFLSDNFRSDPAIVDYANMIEYGNKISSRAFTSKLRYPADFKPGIDWVNVKTNAHITGSNVSVEEIEKVIALLKRITGAGFEGTLGVISPFVDQSKRIEDTIEKEFSLQQRERHELVAQTVHAFQGGERDCIIFSLCGGDFIREGAISFLEKDSRLFNVATSRARASLIVVGDLDWAMQSHIPHIRMLAEASVRSLRSIRVTPWAPYDSPWEKAFAEKLIELDLAPQPQYPVSNRRLDLALVDEERQVYIDVEVDGCAYHRRSDGTRRTEDLWRNHQLRSLGWKILRFWVYELREDIERCALKVKREFENGETQ